MFPLRSSESLATPAPDVKRRRGGGARRGLRTRDRNARTVPKIVLDVLGNVASRLATSQTGAVGYTQPAV